MIKRHCVRFMLGCSVFLLAGCGRSDAPRENAPPAGETPALKGPAQQITLHVEGMTERQGIT
jgi:hypothetical protein